MVNYEYKAEYINKGCEITGILNKQATQGWEYIDTILIHEHWPSTIFSSYAVFRRSCRGQ